MPASDGLPLERSRVLRLRLPSEIMGFDVPFLIYLPKGYGNGGAYPVWYGLHGYSSSETMWMDGERMDLIADEMTASGDIPPLIMVFPLVRYDSAKVIKEDMLDGRRGETLSARFVCEELVPYIDSAFQTDARAESRFIGGFSMGGLFALEIGLRHTGLFSRVSAYSPALALSDYSGDALTNWLFSYQTLGEAPIVGAGENRLDSVSVYLDCGGESDPFCRGIKSLARELPRLGADVVFTEHDGGHSLRRSLLKTYLGFYTSR